MDYLAYYYSQRRHTTLYKFLARRFLIKLFLPASRQVKPVVIIHFARNEVVVVARHLALGLGLGLGLRLGLGLGLSLIHI